MKILAALSLLFGEAIAIYSELLISKGVKMGTLPLVRVTALYFAAGPLLLGGYYWLYKASNNIWVPTLVSLGAIFVIEPIMVWYMFKEPFTTRLMISLALIVSGIILSLK